MQFKLPAEIDTLEEAERGKSFPILSLATGLPLVLNGKPLTITAKGADSGAYQAARIAVDRKRQQILSAGNDYSPVDGQCDLLAAVTTGWDGFEDAKGQPAQCSAENAAALYKSAPAIRDQMDARVHSRANFIKAPATT